MRELILASESVFRRRALALLGLSYSVVPSAIDEAAYPRENATELVIVLAERKALAVAVGHTEAIVVAGDAVVCLGGQILERPRDEWEAVTMLSHLSGKTFDFVSGLAVYDCRTADLLSVARSCSITFRLLTESEIREYVRSAPVLKCSGAFDEDGVLRFSEEVSGCFNFACGLPLPDLIRFLRARGVLV